MMKPLFQTLGFTLILTSFALLNASDGMHPDGDWETAYASASSSDAGYEAAGSRTPLIDDMDKDGVVAVAQNVLQAYPPEEGDDYTRTAVGDFIEGYVVESLLPELPYCLGHIARSVDGTTMLVAIRGINLSEALSPLFSGAPLPFKSNEVSGAVHAYFHEQYGTVNRPIRDALMEVHRGKAGRLVLAGHSRGGALASIGHVQASSMAKLNRMTAKIDTLAIGSPAVFDEDLVKSFNTVVGESFGKLITYVHEDDWVAKSGSSWPTYTAGDLTRLADLAYADLRPSWEAQYVGNVICGPRFEEGSGGTAPHLIASYMKTLKS